LSEHKPLPKAYKTASGWRINCIGPNARGQWFRMPEPFDQEVPMPNGDIYVLVRNYPGSPHEWAYVEKGLLTSERRPGA
jgi:hypothetical protein